MAYALISGFVREGFPKEKIYICVRNRESVERWKSEGYFADITPNFYKKVTPKGFIILAVKPQEFLVVIEELKKERWSPTSPHDVIFISVMAGITLPTLAQAVSHINITYDRIVRFMPNLNCTSGNGTVLICPSKDFPVETLILLQKMCLAVGGSNVISEKEFDAASTITGCGPAFIYTLVEAMADGAVLNGLNRKLAVELAAETVKGSAAHILASGRHPGDLKDSVCSPSGSTISGLRVLEKSAFRSAFIEAITASTQRGFELGKKEKQSMTDESSGCLEDDVVGRKRKRMVQNSVVVDDDNDNI